MTYRLEGGAAVRDRHGASLPHHGHVTQDNCAAKREAWLPRGSSPPPQSDRTFSASSRQERQHRRGNDQCSEQSCEKSKRVQGVPLAKRTLIRLEIRPFPRLRAGRSLCSV